MNFIGIDNGTSGAIAVLDPQGEVLEMFKMPVTKVGDAVFIYAMGLCEMIERHPSTYVVAEQGQKNPMFGTKGNFANGYSFGVVKTILDLTGRPHVLINPKTWQKIIFKDIRRGPNDSTKNLSCEFARRRWPSISLLATARSKKPDDGLADALCLAEYGRLTFAVNR